LAIDNGYETNPSKHAMEEAIAAFGYDDAEELFTTFFVSLEESVDELCPPEGIARVCLNFNGALPGAYLGAYLDRRGMGLTLNPNFPVTQLLNIIPPILHHEVSHAVRAQKGRRDGLLFKSDIGQSTFSRVLDEGLAWETTRNKFGDEYDVTQPFKKKTLQKRASKLIDMPHHVLSDQLYYKYLFGTERKPNRGYAVGQFMISTVATDWFDHDAFIFMHDADFYTVLSEKVKEYDWQADETAA
jgi:hypothetical protein